MPYTQATAVKELATLRCAHAELEADHAQAISAHAALERQLFSLKDLQSSHDRLEVQPLSCLVKTNCAAPVLPFEEYVYCMAPLATFESRKSSAEGGAFRGAEWTPATQAEHAEAKAAHSALQGSHADLQNRHATLTEQHRELTAAHAKLSESLSSLQGQLQGHQETQKAHAELQGQHEGLQGELAATQAKHEAAQKQLSQHEPLQKQLTALQAEHAALQQAHDTLKAQLSDKRGSQACKGLGSLETQLTASQQALSELQAAHKTLEQEHSQLKEELSAAEVNTEKSKSRCKELSEAPGRAARAAQEAAGRSREARPGAERRAGAALQRSCGAQGRHRQACRQRERFAAAPR